MEHTINKQKTYEIKGFYYGEDRNVFGDTHFHTVGCDSMIDHQKTWYNEAKKLGYESGELDEAGIIRTNYNGDLTEGQILAIVNDGDLMDTPFDTLFPRKLKEYVRSDLEAEYGDLEQYVLDNESEKDCTQELEQMKTIQNEISRISFHVN